MAPVATSLDRYDTIGVGYRRHRRPDPRIAARIHAALGDAHRIIDVGCGAGSYEPHDRCVVGLDGSTVMLAQHPGPRRVRGAAEALPFATGAFDAAMAIFTVHHWDDVDAGLTELRRVARRQVILTFDPAMEGRFWLSDYVPAIIDLNQSLVSTIERVAQSLDTDRVEVVPVPHDCVDGFMAAHWRRPARYLEPSVRASMSGLARLPSSDVERAMLRLAGDLESGAWRARYGHLLELDELDTGYRLVVAGAAA